MTHEPHNTEPDSIGRLERTEPLLAGYRTAGDLLAKARRGLERYKQDPMSIDGTDVLSDLILTAHSLCDWVYEHHVQPGDAERRARGDFDRWRREQIEACQDIAVLDELANAFKHRTLDRPGALLVESVRAGTIIYEVEPGFEQYMLDRLATFGEVEPAGALVGDDEIDLFRARHTAHIVYLSHAESERRGHRWHYVIDVINRTLTHWANIVAAQAPD